jgi:hypothetical protein
MSEASRQFSRYLRGETDTPSVDLPKTDSEQFSALIRSATAAARRAGNAPKGPEGGRA